MLETVERVVGGTGASARVDASVVWLHGLGADGHDFEPIVPELSLPPGRLVRFVFPHAPLRPVTLNNGFVMRAWYDILALDNDAPQDEAGIRASAREVEQLLAREGERGVPGERIVLAGFSQGGAVALHTGLRYGTRLAGLVGLSCYLPLLEHASSEVAPANAGTPVLLGHGTLDPVLPVFKGVEACDWLRHHGYDVRWRAYTMAHAVCPEEIRDVSAFLREVL